LIFIFPLSLSLPPLTPPLFHVIRAKPRCPPTLELTCLTHLHEPEILHALQLRYQVTTTTTAVTVMLPVSVIGSTHLLRQLHSYCRFNC
jgi:hypothetical protein